MNSFIEKIYNCVCFKRKEEIKRLEEIKEKLENIEIKLKIKKKKKKEKEKRKKKKNIE